MKAKCFWVIVGEGAMSWFVRCGISGICGFI